MFVPNSCVAISYDSPGSKVMMPSSCHAITTVSFGVAARAAGVANAIANAAANATKQSLFGILSSLFILFDYSVLNAACGASDQRDDCRSPVKDNNLI